MFLSFKIYLETQRSQILLYSVLFYWKFTFLKSVIVQGTWRKKKVFYFIQLCKMMKGWFYKFHPISHCVKFGLDPSHHMLLLSRSCLGGTYHSLCWYLTLTVWHYNRHTYCINCIIIPSTSPGQVSFTVSSTGASGKSNSIYSTSYYSDPCFERHSLPRWRNKQGFFLLKNMQMIVV